MRTPLLMLLVLAAACELERTSPVVTPDEVDLSGYPQRAAFSATAETFETTSATLTDIPGGELIFVPRAGEAWLLLFSARVGSSSTAERSAEVAYVVDGAVRGGGGSQNAVAFASGPWQHLDWLTGSGAQVHIRAQLRSLNGATARIEALAIVAFRVPEGAIHMIAADAEQLVTNAAYATVASLELTPDSAGDYLLMGVINAREAPGLTDVHVRWRSPSGALWSSHLQNARSSDQSFFVARRATVDAVPQTFAVEALGSSSGAGSTVHSARLVALRLDAFAQVYSAETGGVTINGSAPVTVAEVVTEGTPTPARYVTIQSTSPDGACGIDPTLMPSFVRDGVVNSAFAHAPGSCVYLTTYGDVRLLETADPFVVTSLAQLPAGETSTAVRDAVIHVLRLGF